MFSAKPDIATISQRLALVCALLLLSAQTLALAHAHEQAAEPACAICTVSGDDTPLPESVVSIDYGEQTGIFSSQIILHIVGAPRRSFQPRAPPRF